MNLKTLKKHSVWLSQLSAAISLVLVLYIKSKRVFVNENEAAALLLIAMIATTFTFIFGILSVPRWQGFLALAIFSYTAYCVLFTSMLGIH